MKSVAIIGAGPAGLVAAKTLLHSYPKNTFSVSVFEHAKTVGGLWAVESNPQGMINPEMRTNLSQFTVCFSDLAWDTLGLQPLPNTYPKAWQVNRYLESYAQKFIPAGTIAFETRVKLVEQIHLGWRLTTVDLESQTEKVNTFDYLTVASGFFSEPRPLNFGLDGIDTSFHILHSSQYRKLGDLSSTGQQAYQGKVLVVGGSHSGAEVAATIAMQMSDARYSPSGSVIEPLEIVHVMPYPLVAIPTVVQTGKASSPTFLPLDSVLYDISSRSEGPISFKYGHSTPEKKKQLRDVLNNIMNGAKSEEDKNDSSDEPSIDSASPYAVVSDNYVEFVRSGAIRPVLGRLLRLEGQFEKDSQRTSRVRAKMSPGEPDIEDIAAVVNATGFSSSPSVDFMPKNVLETLDYDASYPRLPLLLHQDALTSSDTGPNSLAVMGSFDGSYWGVLETQARVIANKWAHDDQSKQSQPNEKSAKLYSHMKEIRSIMKEDPSKVPQNFFGDYPGLLEETSRDLELRRIDLLWGPKEGIVSPARYVDGGGDVGQAIKTMEKLQSIMDTSANLRAFSAKGAFRALQGKWQIESNEFLDPDFEASPATATFHPRYPTDPASDLEYLFIVRSDVAGRDLQKLVYRLRERDNLIEVWNVRLAVAADNLLHTMEFSTAKSDEQNSLSVSVKSTSDTIPQKTTVYSFYFAGVHITKFTTKSYSDDLPLDRRSVLNFSRA